MNKLDLAFVDNYLVVEDVDIQEKLIFYRRMLEHKIIVLDDDPTGVQTVNNVFVYTDWSLESIEEGFLGEQSMFYILTNSRSFSAEKTVEVHKEIAKNITKIAKKLGLKFILISRGDSTLRGHYPLETQVLKDEIESSLDMKFDGEIICPFFGDAGRLTIENIHYITEAKYLIPVGDTEFAKDTTFGFSCSHLGEYIEEKTEGQYKKEACTYISLSDIRSVSVDKIMTQLINVQQYNKVIVNALNDHDLEVFTLALFGAIRSGKNFLFRTAASLPKIIGGIKNRPYLSREELTYGGNQNGGLVFVGSHVQKTTQQLEAIFEADLDLDLEEFRVDQVYIKNGLRMEVKRLVEKIEDNMIYGKTTVVYTSRKLITAPTNENETALGLSVSISEGLTDIVRHLTKAPRFIVAKGGITSSSIGTKGLLVKKAYVLGQVCAGIPVWITDEGSKFPNIPYIIFPGNVGNKETLKDILELLI